MVDRQKLLHLCPSCLLGHSWLVPLPGNLSFAAAGVCCEQVPHSGCIEVVVSGLGGFKGEEMWLPIIHLHPLNVLPPASCNNIPKLVLRVNMRRLMEDGEEVVQDAGGFDDEVNMVWAQMDGAEQYSPPCRSNAEGILHTPSARGED